MKCDNVVWWWKVPLQRNEFNFMIFCCQMNNFIVKLFGQKGAGKLSKKPFIFQYDMPKSCKVMVGKEKFFFAHFKCAHGKQCINPVKWKNKEVKVCMCVEKFQNDWTIQKRLSRVKRSWNCYYCQCVSVSVWLGNGIAAQTHWVQCCGVVRVPLLSLKTINEALIDE